MAAPLTALPPIPDLASAASYHLSLAPYFSPSYLLPRVQTLLATRDLATLQAWYTTTNPASTALIMSQFVAALAFVLSTVNQNYSWIDRLWSLLPVMYAGHYSVWGRLVGEETGRVDLLTTVVAIWGARLTFNYWRKGGYGKGHEDYRWEILQKYIKGPAWTLFNITFISWYQSVLLFSVTLPGYILLLSSRAPLSAAELKSTASVDFWFSNGILLAILLEVFADQQQWNFHQAKALYKKTGEVARGYAAADLERGFCVDGLWAFSRHPNFLGEQLVWCLAYQWTCSVTGVLYNYAALAAFQYISLFQGSTMFTEWISAGKYPQYKQYQKMVAKFVPSYKAIFGMETFEEEVEDKVRGVTAEAKKELKKQK